MPPSNPARFARGAVAVVVLFAAHARGAPPPATPLTLDAAIAAARQHNPALAASSGRIAEARAAVTGARAPLADNPELALSVGPRLSRGDARLALEVAVEQRFETGGQRHLRLVSAEAGVDVAAALAEDTRRLLEAAVASAFFERLAAGRRLELLTQDEEMARALRDVAQRRLDVGEGAAITLSATRIRLAEAGRQTLVARAERDGATVRLAALLGLPADTPLALAGSLPEGEAPPGADELVTHAVASRPDVAALAHASGVAAADVDLADADAWPDVTVGAGYAADDGDHLVTATVRVPLPFFDSNQGERARARAVRARLEIQREGQRLAADAEVRQALLAYAQARAALELYDAEVLRAQDEALTLLRRAVEAGEVGIADVIVVQREVLEGRAGYLDARLALAHARVQLLAAVNLSQTGSLELPQPSVPPGDTP